MIESPQDEGGAPAPGSRPRPEVLAPAGDARALAAAVRAGADAVYFGLQDWNARVRARNFDLGDLAQTIRELHRDGVRAYLTFNTLLFGSEQAAARTALEQIAAAGPDALIVQDLGVARWVREHLPEVTIHASTQMTVSSVEGVDFLRRFRVERVILARELTIPEIRRIRAATDVELEVFVHGALCVSYSGQCLSSEAWGGRSANRGQCAQACRLPYELLVDGHVHDLGDRAYLLSPRDLEGFRRIPELIDAGVHGFKIEGRMKSAEYVGAVTALYREAVDRAWKPHGARLDPLAEDARRIFSRGASEGFLGGVNHQILVDGTSRAHRGVRVGVVTQTGRDWIEIAPDADAPRLTPGDGVLVASGPREEVETGAKIFAVEPGDLGGWRLRFGRAHPPEASKTTVGAEVFLTHDHALQAEWARRVEDPAHRKRILLDMDVEGHEGGALRVICTDPQGRRVEVSSATPLMEADRHGLDADVLRSHLGRLGTTRYMLAQLDIRLAGSLALPVRELNEMRRSIVGAIETLREQAGVAPAPPPASPVARTDAPLASPIADAVARAEPAPAGTPARADAMPIDPAPRGDRALAVTDPFVVLCRSEEQVASALEEGARRITLDFLDLVGLKQAGERVRAAGAELTLALPRIQKPGEEKIWDFFLARQPDRILVRNLATIARFAGVPDPPVLVADVSLNAVNAESFRVLLEAGCSFVSPGLDLNGTQLLELLDEVPPGSTEIPVHHHLPVFHTEHCVFAAFLSDGADWRTCGRPCDRHRIHLRDRTGQEHAVIADVGCRNTVFGARPQSIVALFPQLRARGVASLRVELLEQDGDATRELLGLVRAAWDGTLAPAEALRRLQAEGRFGVFAGFPEPPRQPDWKPQGGRRRTSRPQPERGKPQRSRP